MSSINGANAQAIHSSNFDLLEWNIISGVAVAATGVSHYLATTANGTGVWSPSGTFANTASDFELGTRIDGQHPFPGDFAELLIYGRALTSDERAQVVAYLQGVYGL